jgi:nickel-type superoxide dismutase maturation protease
MFGFHFCKVTGMSMSPRIPDNSYVFVVPWLNIVKLKEGALLKVSHPRYGYIVKSLAKVDRNGFFWLRGLHKTSVPIEKIGPVGKTQIQGKVLWIFPPKP